MNQNETTKSIVINLIKLGGSIVCLLFTFFACCAFIGYSFHYLVSVAHSVNPKAFPDLDWSPWQYSLYFPFLLLLILLWEHLEKIYRGKERWFSLSRDYTQPPQRAKLLLQLLPLKYREAMVDDLQEDYELFKADHGAEKAYYFYWWQVIAAYLAPIMQGSLIGGAAAAIRKLIGWWW